MENYIGKVIDNRYEVLSLIGVGGMANVYKAVDSQTGSEVAIKFLKEEFFGNEELVRRFKNESKAISLLNHECIIKVIDFNITENEKYLVVEYINGITLKEFIEKQGKLEWDETLVFADIILSALGYAHDNGVVHRDLKPHNIMLTREGHLKIMDFGIARLATANQRTVTDKAIGSVHYISPEQVRGQSTDNRSDIYSIGIMMYEMLTGKLPFHAESAVSVAMQQLSDDAQPIGELVDGVPKGMELIVMKAIEKDPDKRYQSAADMRRDLQKLKDNPNFVPGAATGVSVVTEERTVMVDTMAKKKQDKVKVKKGKKLLLPIMAGLATAFLISAAVAIYFIFKMSGNPLLTRQPDIELPNFVGMTEQEIKKSNYNFKFEFDYKYSDEYAKDVVLSQNPKAPRTVKEKSIVKLVVSKGVMSSEMPDLTNYTRSEAQKILSEFGVNISFETEDTKKVPNGNVIRTEPAAGEIITSGSLVTIYVAVDQEQRTKNIPNVIGMNDLEKAQKVITTSGMRVGSIEYKHSSDEEGTIIDQSPKAGTEMPVGSTITIVISKGPEECGICGSSKHETDDHPRCPVCGSKEHKEHPECEHCGSDEHETEDHPLCEYCESPNHSTSDHPLCGNCGSPDHTTDNCDEQEESESGSSSEDSSSESSSTEE